MEDEASLAPLIKNEFGEIRFAELTSVKAMRRFNALYGSNSRPRSQIKFIADKTNEQLIGSNVYFDELEQVDSEINVKLNSYVAELKKKYGHLEIKPGTMIWNFSDIMKNSAFIACRQHDRQQDK